MYDLAILGGGPAGYSAAFEAVKHAMSVVLFERNVLGGTCLNRGCVPTKYLLHVAQEYAGLKILERDGVHVQTVQLNFEKTRRQMQSIVSSLFEGLKNELNSSNIQMVSGDAILKDKNSVKCGGCIYEARNILIATGSAPADLIVPNACTSDAVLQIKRVPERLHIIGGGTVAVEFAEIFQMLGSDVTISIRADRILRKWDKEIAIGLTKNMKKKGIKINTNCDFSMFKARENETVLSAVGRKAVIPETMIDLFDIGGRGGILVNENGKTRTDGIFAAGDVVEGSQQLAHIGMDEGRCVVRYIAGEENEKAPAVVRCVYTSQEIASVGLTESDAKEKGIAFVSAKQTMFSNARTMIAAAERGFIKILAEKQTGKIIGAHLMCKRAGDIVSELALAMNNGLTVYEMLCSVRPHPSYTEAVTEALRQLEGKLRAV